eukprot:4650562-Prymnesium_polylepis.2
MLSPCASGASSTIPKFVLTEKVLMKTIMQSPAESSGRGGSDGDGGGGSGGDGDAGGDGGDGGDAGGVGGRPGGSGRTSNREGHGCALQLD